MPVRVNLLDGGPRGLRRAATLPDALGSDPKECDPTHEIDADGLPEGATS